jgi:hypothetical protein
VASLDAKRAKNMDFFSDPLKIEYLLLLSKRLEPLAADRLQILRHIQDYPEVEKLNEAEVRSFIIDPLLRVLGYDHGTPYSTRLETPLVFYGQRRRSDYQGQLWKENFWLLEAKKPQPRKQSFSYKDFRQALEYSVHPSVNAALIALCDGLKLEIFDREVSVEKPVLHVDMKNLIASIDQIRALLDPMQVWFFQKRRVLRLVDRVLDKEFILDRIGEFSELVQRRLRSKQNIAIKNYQQMMIPGSDDHRKRIERASLAELTEIHLMRDYPVPTANAINRRLVEISMPSAFNTMYRVLPDHPRLVNDSYMSQTVAYLARLGQMRETVEYLPAWLSPRRQADAPLDAAIKRLLNLSLTYFKDYEPYRLVLLAAWAIRRFCKIHTVALGASQTLGAGLHALVRFNLPEVSWDQVLASPQAQLLGFIETSTRTLFDTFMHENTADDGSFKVESAKLALKIYWGREKTLLAALPNYPALLKERGLEDMCMTECACISYDNLAQYTLARLHPFPKWKTYLVEERRDLLEEAASAGSVSAKDLLGIPREVPFRMMSDEELAARFFLGDVRILNDLRQAYNGPDTRTEPLT